MENGKFIYFGSNSIHNGCAINIYGVAAQLFRLSESRVCGFSHCLIFFKIQ